MRLQEVYSRCRKAMRFFSYINEYKRRQNGREEFLLPDYYEIEDFFRTLEPIAFFRNDIAALRSMYNYAYTSTMDETGAPSKSVDKTNSTTFYRNFDKLCSKVSTITGLFDSIGYCQYEDDRNTETGIDIKLPPNISLIEISKCTRDLNTIFTTCPLITANDGSVSFSAVDVGSVWFSFIVGGASVVAILHSIAALVDKALIIRSHYLTTKEQMEKIKTLAMGNEILESATKLNDSIGKELLNKVSSELASKNNITNPEDIERVKNCLKSLSDWMTKGLEVYASIEAPSEIKAVFPPVEKQALPDSAIKLLTDGLAKDEQK